MEHDHGDVALRELLEAGLSELGLASSPSGERLARLAFLLAQWASKLNLTAHRDAESIARRLILDAVALGHALPGGVTGSIADLGSGAGFPGIPIGVVWSSARITLIEARERRHHFQRTAIRRLEATNISPRLGRAEELAVDLHRVVIAQAMADPATALGWMRRWVAPSGWLVVPLSESQEPFEPPGGVVPVEIRAYQVPLGGVRRLLWIGRSDPPTGDTCPTPEPCDT